MWFMHNKKSTKKVAKPINNKKEELFAFTDDHGNDNDDDNHNYHFQNNNYHYHNTIWES